MNSASYVPFSFWKSYQQYLDQECLKTVSRASEANGQSSLSAPAAPLSVGIVGGGMAGLYSALLLQKHIPGVKVKIFEAGARLGGRVYTHKFSSEPYQYFDTGAMRFPDAESHRPIFTLIDYLNHALPDDTIVLKEYVNSCPEGNRVFLNNKKQKDGCIMSAKYASEHCDELGFQTEEVKLGIDGAQKLLYDALTPVVEALEADFDAALKKYCRISLFDYLSKDLGWSRQKIQYVEAIAGVDSNEFRFDLIFELVMRRSGLDTATWKTIEGGMSKLPEHCARVLAGSGNVSILLNSKVEAIKLSENGFTQVGYRGADESLICESFDAIILAIPPPHIRTILERPFWGYDLEIALRAAIIGTACKVLLQFKSRFWERPGLQLPPSLGGVSITDLPIRYVLYPSHGIGDAGKGVLCCQQRYHDSRVFTLLSKGESVKLALQNLQQLYPEANIAEEFAGGKECEITEDAVFIQNWSIGAVFYYPGDFVSFYPSLVAPRGNIYFAGSHLSPNLVWIAGALESAKRAVQQLMLRQYGVENVTYL